MTTRPRRLRTYNKIFRRERKIAKGRYGSGYYLTNVKKSAASKYRQQKKR